MNLKGRLKPAFWDHPAPPDSHHLSYRRMWKQNFAVAAVVTLLPLVILAWLGLYQMTRLAGLEFRQQKLLAQRALACAAQRLDMLFSERLAALGLVSRLAGQGEKGLAEAFRRLSETYAGFGGLAFCGPGGDTIAKVGPAAPPPPARTAELATSLKQGHGAVSPVWTAGGKRWFAAALRQPGGPEGRVLLGILPAGELERAVAGSLAIPQAQSFLFHGRDLAARLGAPGPPPSALQGPPPTSNPRVWACDDACGQSRLLGLVRVGNTPFTLAGSMPLNLPGAGPGWHLNLFAAAALCALIMLAVVAKGTLSQVERLYQAHLEQSQVLREVVYTQKLASIGRLASGVAHQVNNPMAIINEKVGLLKDLVSMGMSGGRQPDPARLTRLVTDVEEAVQRVKSITGRLLGFARHLPLGEQPLRVDLVLKEVADFLAGEARQREVEIELSLPEEGLTLQSDQGLLEQVFLNVMNNAVAAAKHGGHIEVSLRPLGRGGAQVTVRDDGRGMTPEQLANLFEPYFTTKGELGSGLGLYITHGLVDRLGGQIRAENLKTGGACFSITLPAALPAPAAEAMAAPTAPTATADRPAEAALPKVLLVDDEEDYLEILAERLAARGFRVQTADQAHQALNFLQNGDYAAVVMDMMMPGLSGMEALKKIHSLRPELKVVLQTGHATPETEAKARSLGAVGLMQKPVDLDRLAGLIGNGQHGKAKPSRKEGRS